MVESTGLLIRRRKKFLPQVQILPSPLFSHVCATGMADMRVRPDAAHLLRFNETSRLVVRFDHEVGTARAATFFAIQLLPQTSDRRFVRLMTDLQ